MITVNPFSQLAESVTPILMQAYVIAMIILVLIGTIFDIIHKKNVKYFFVNARKAKKQATRNLRTGEKTSVLLRTIASDILTTSELGAGKRRISSLTWYVRYNNVLVDHCNYDFLLSNISFNYTFHNTNSMALRSTYDLYWWLLVLVFSQS